MQTNNVNADLFEKYLKRFINFVEHKSNEKFISFASNRYTEYEEGYKRSLYRMARDSLKYWTWNKNDIGSGKIATCLLNAIKIQEPNNNLIDWRIKSKLENTLLHPENIKANEKLIFEFYKNIIPEHEAFTKLTNIFGTNYQLISYLFFIKDMSRFAPVTPSYFELSFQKLGVKLKLSHKCSWGNYKDFNNILREIKYLLTVYGIQDVNLLDAHSFLWIIATKVSDNEIDDKNITISVTDFIEPISYKYITQKMRIGQNKFREQLLTYWDGACSVTGVRLGELLEAAHIKPVVETVNTEGSSDLYNGLLLLPNLHKLFDQGYITFDAGGHIIISPSISKQELKPLGVDTSMSLRKISKKHDKYLEYHREFIFKHKH